MRASRRRVTDLPGTFGTRNDRHASTPKKPGRSRAVNWPKPGSRCNAAKRAADTILAPPPLPPVLRLGVGNSLPLHIRWMIGPATSQRANMVHHIPMTRPARPPRRRARMRPHKLSPSRMTPPDLGINAPRPHQQHHQNPAKQAVHATLRPRGTHRCKTIVLVRMLPQTGSHFFSPRTIEPPMPIIRPSL